MGPGSVHAEIERHFTNEEAMLARSAKKIMNLTQRITKKGIDYYHGQTKVSIQLQIDASIDFQKLNSDHNNS